MNFPTIWQDKPITMLEGQNKWPINKEAEWYLKFILVTLEGTTCCMTTEYINC